MYSQLKFNGLDIDNICAPEDYTSINKSPHSLKPYNPEEEAVAISKPIADNDREMAEAVETFTKYLNYAWCNNTNIQDQIPKQFFNK